MQIIPQTESVKAKINTQLPILKNSERAIDIIITWLWALDAAIASASSIF